mmetsp:Transcript_7310/g.8345  ORF Transcript_7310/g.8345 Transcript_7310/m.8345 type:complete len:1119 (+) Transcript_7310:178-3534(+)
MYEQEEEVIHLDYNSEDEYDIDNDDDDDDDDDDDESVPETNGESESRLMDYLLKGLVLQSCVCGKCNTPLIMSLAIDDDPVPVVPGAPIEPIPGVPFCVACEAHVVTKSDELQTMWKDEYKGLMSCSGAVLLYMDEAETQPVFGQTQVGSGSEEDEGEGDQAFGYPDTMDLASRSDSEAENSGEEGSEKEEGEEAYDQIDDEIAEEHASIQSEEEDQEEEIVEVDEEVEEEVTENSPTTADDPSVASIAKVDSLPATSVDEDEINFDSIDYDKRRQIATKVLGSMMIEGYTLRETQCQKCSMPFMETPDTSELLCVVCPVLEKKILKKINQRKAIEAEKKRIEDEKKRVIREREEAEARKALEEELEKARIEEAKLAEARETSEGERKVRVREELKKQLEAENRELEELKFRRDVVSRVPVEDNLDDDEENMREALRKAKVAVELEEKRLKELERERNRKRQEAERLRLIEELRIAKEERIKDEKRREQERQEADKRAAETKKLEAEREEERQKLINELRVARQERIMEEMRRKEDAIIAKKKAAESEKLMKMRDEERKAMKAELEESKKTQKEQESVRKEEMEKAEQRAKEAEQQLSKYRETAEIEAKRTEEVRAAAERRVRDAEQARGEAEILAREAKEAKAHARAEKARLSEYKRLTELANRAEQHRLQAEAQANDAQLALRNVDVRVQKVNRRRQKYEGMLSRQANEAVQKLSMYERDEPDEIGLTVSSAGDDWGARCEIGKQVLANRLVSGWMVMPEYCFGRMCNFAPLISRGDTIECVVCEGSGNGDDGFYEEVNPDDILDDTMSFIMKRKRYEKISTSMRRMNVDHSPESSHEVGRRMKMGWVLHDAPCPACLMPLLSETMRSPEVCVFCDPEEDIEIEGSQYGVPDDDASYSSRRSVTIELPPNFDPTDPNAMAQLAAQAAQASSGGSVISRSSRQSRNSYGGGRSVSRPRSQPQQYGGGPPRRNLPPQQGRYQQMGRQMRGPNLPRRTMRSQSPRPESRQSTSSGRRSVSNGRPNFNNRASAPMFVPMHRDVDCDDASDISDGVSVARSVASHTLDAIMSKIENCKDQLRSTADVSDGASVASRAHSVMLLQKLTAAAAAVRQLEESAE